VIFDRCMSVIDHNAGVIRELKKEGRKKEGR
jgi:hypothetical protein